MSRLLHPPGSAPWAGHPPPPQGVLLGPDPAPCRECSLGRTPPPRRECSLGRKPPTRESSLGETSTDPGQRAGPAGHMVSR